MKLKLILKEMENDKIKKAVDQWIIDLDQYQKDYYKRMGYKLPSDVHGVVEGKRYFKVTTTTHGGEGQRSVFAFVDKSNGDIFKPAGWNTPAKGARGNVLNDKKPMDGRSLYK